MPSILKVESLFTLSILSVVCMADNWIGPGKWSMTGTMSCANADQYPYKFDLSRKRINRTHEGISAQFVFPEDLDDSVGIRIVVCKFVDGGCKPYRVVTDKCFPKFCKKYIADNIREIFQLAGIDPPDFPVKAGKYAVAEYLFDYGELPASAAYGSFQGTLYLTRNLVDLSCLVMLMEFNEDDE